MQRSGRRPSAAGAGAGAGEDADASAALGPAVPLALALCSAVLAVSGFWVVALLLVAAAGAVAAGGRPARALLVSAAVPVSYAWLAYRRLAAGGGRKGGDAAAAATQGGAKGPVRPKAVAPAGAGAVAGHAPAPAPAPISASAPTAPAPPPAEADPFQTVPHWMPDYASDACLSCSRPFTLRRRRHHCRCCGRLVCASCSGQRRVIPRSIVFDGAVRVCDECCDEIDSRAARGAQPRQRVRAAE